MRKAGSGANPLPAFAELAHCSGDGGGEQGAAEADGGEQQDDLIKRIAHDVSLRLIDESQRLIADLL